jgi:uncharacterized membrane protein YeiH
VTVVGDFAARDTEVMEEWGDPGCGVSGAVDDSGVAVEVTEGAKGCCAGDAGGSVAIVESTLKASGGGVIRRVPVSEEFVTARSSVLAGPMKL